MFKKTENRLLKMFFPKEKKKISENVRTWAEKLFKDKSNPV